MGCARTKVSQLGEAPLRAQKGDMPNEGYRPYVGWLELVLRVLLALGVLGWRTSKEKNNGEAP